MKILSFLFVILFTLSPAIAGKKTVRPCVLQNKTFCGDWGDFRLYGDYIEWDEKYRDIAHCTVLDENRLTDRVYSVLRCTEQRHLQGHTCKDELSYRVKGMEPQRCIDPKDGKGHSYTIEKPQFWMLVARQIHKQPAYPEGLEYTQIIDNHINCLFMPDDTTDGRADTLFSEKNICDTDRQFTNQVNKDIMPDFIKE